MRHNDDDGELYRIGYELISVREIHSPTTDGMTCHSHSVRRLHFCCHPFIRMQSIQFNRAPANEGLHGSMPMDGSIHIHVLGRHVSIRSKTQLNITYRNEMRRRRRRVCDAQRDSARGRQRIDEKRNAEIKSSKVIRCASKPQIPMQSKQRGTKRRAEDNETES